MRRSVGQPFNGHLRYFGLVFADAKFVEFKMAEVGDSGQLKGPGAAMEWTAINHHHFGRALNGRKDGFDLAADASKAAHFCNSQLLEAASRAIGQLAGV